MFGKGGNVFTTALACLYVFIWDSLGESGGNSGGEG